MRGPLAIFSLNRGGRLCPPTPEEDMSARPAAAAQPAQKAQRELEDLQFVMRARNGDQAALDQLIRRYTGFVRLKASSYFLAGGHPEDLVQEGLIGLYKAVRDFRPDKETSFRSFAELCVISTEELQSLVFTLGTGLSKLESDALRLYLEGSSYEEMAAELGCDTKTIDNALQRVKRKVLNHQRSRQVLQ